MKITIDIDKIKKLAQDSKDIFLTPEAENTILELLKAQEEVDQAIDYAKQVLEKEALKLNPNFSAIKSDKVKVFYRTFGSVFSIDESKLDTVPKEMYEVVKKISANKKVIEYFEKENGFLPDGVIINERKKRIGFTKIKGVEDE